MERPQLEVSSLKLLLQLVEQEVLRGCSRKEEHCSWHPAEVLVTMKAVKAVDKGKTPYWPIRGSCS